MSSTRSATRPWFCVVSAPITAHCSAVDSSMRVKLVVASCRGYARVGSGGPVRLSCGQDVAGGELAVAQAGAGRARVPPSVNVASTSTAASRSRSSRGGGKYSSSSVIRTSSTPVDGREAGDDVLDELLGRRRAGGDADVP